MTYLEKKKLESVFSDIFKTHRKNFKKTGQLFQVCNPFPAAKDNEYVSYCALVVLLLRKLKHYFIISISTNIFFSYSYCRLK